MNAIENMKLNWAPKDFAIQWHRHHGWVGGLIAVGFLGLPLSLHARSLWEQTQPQYLPVSASMLTPAGDRLELEVAQTESQQFRGLRHRLVLPENRGMIFPVTPARTVQFWMAGVTQPLDVVFLYQGKIVGLINVLPCQHHCPVYSSPKLVDQVLELAAGQSTRQKFSIGVSISVDFSSPD